MPFFDDSGPKVEEEKGPLGRTFALLKEQLERMVALNLFWVAQGFPFLAAWAFPMHDILRIGLSLYTALAIPVASSTCFAVLYQVSRGEPLNLNLLLDSLRETYQVALLKFMPLYSLFFFLVALANFAAGQNWLILDVLLRLGILLLLATALYWGAILAAQPDWSILRIMREAAQLFWQQLSQSLILLTVSAFILLLGFISVAGLILIVPIVLMLLQIEFYRASRPETEF